MKSFFYILAGAVAFFALWSLIQGIQAYSAGEGFQYQPFGIALLGILLAAVWFKRARTM